MVMPLFIGLAALMVVVALVVLLLPMRGGRDPASKQRALLQQARAGGVLSEAEYQVKLAALPLAPGTPHATPRGWLPGLALCVDRTSVVEGKSVAVRVDFGGRRIIKKTTSDHAHNTDNTPHPNYDI